MKRLLVLTSLAGLAAQPVLAQTTPPSTTTGATAETNTNIVAVGGTTNTPADTTADINYSGHTWTTPNVSGGYFGGTNPCLVGTGGGAAGGPIGFSINLGRSDEACTRRSDAAAWHAMGYDNIAVTRMCQDTKNADAFFSTTGFACPGTNASSRYKRADGSPAPEMRLVSDAKSLPRDMRTSQVDMSNPAVRQAVMAQAQLLAEQMVAQRMQKQPFPQPSFTPGEPQQPPLPSDPGNLPPNGTK